MKNSILFVPVLVLLIACGGVKKTQKAVNAGDYTSAINEALQNLAENKSKKSHQPYILLLEDAYKKNVEREMKYIEFLEKDGNEANYENIYNSYVGLRDVQERIRPLLPLQILEENRTAEFSFVDYDNDIIDYKEDFSEYLFDNAEDLLTNATSKRDYRKAYKDFVYLEKISPGFEDTRQKIEEALEKGIDYVEVQVQNNSNQIIPVRLSEELLNFNTFG
jgi:predicted Holliday junction resolvase-like endonuclease